MTMMTGPKFGVGQAVSFHPGVGAPQQVRGRYTVVRLLPSAPHGRQYRVRSERDGHERVVLESQLAAAGAPAPADADRPGATPG
jgi:hypothetical protein